MQLRRSRTPYSFTSRGEYSNYKCACECCVVFISLSGATRHVFFAAALIHNYFTPAANLSSRQGVRSLSDGTHPKPACRNLALTLLPQGVWNARKRRTHTHRNREERRATIICLCEVRDLEACPVCAERERVRGRGAPLFIPLTSRRQALLLRRK